MLCPKWDICITPFLPRLRDHFRQWTSKKAVFSRHNEAVAQMNLQQLRQNTQDTHRLRPEKVLAWRGRSGHQVPSLAKELSATGSCWKRESQFHYGCGPQWAGRALVKATHPRVYGKHRWTWWIQEEEEEEERWHQVGTQRNGDGSGRSGEMK